jgi:polysaccharide export outer membrane protein
MQPMTRYIHSLRRASIVAVATLFCVGAGVMHAQNQGQTQKPPQAPGTTTKPGTKPNPTPTVPTAPDLAPDYVIGPDDVLSVQFWSDKEMSTDVTVRPDGKVTMLMINDIQAAGYTPLQFQQKLIEAYKPFQDDPNITVAPKQIHSRKVFIQGEVGKQGSYDIPGSGLTVVQLVALAGGFTEYAKKDQVSILRAGQAPIPVNFKEIEKRKNLGKNLVQLKPGDTIIVP